MRAAQVLDMQADLLSRLDDYRFRNVMQASFELDHGRELARTRAEHEQIARDAAGFVDAFRMHVKAAYAYRVTPDMAALVQHAAAGLDETDTFDGRLAPTACGIVRFDQPMPVADVRGRTMMGHWMIWGPVRTSQGTRTLMTWFNDGHEPDEVAFDGDLPEAAVRALGRWFWMGADVAPNGAELGPPETRPHAEQVALLASQGVAALPTTNSNRYVHALWMLLNQTIADVHDEAIDKPAAKRAKRKGLPARVTVIELRRSSSSVRAEGESQVEWSHRWLVRGYWRWTHYGPRNADHVHAFAPGVAEDGNMVRACVIEGCENSMQRIYVHGHVKGPEGAPLVVTDKVYELRR